MSYAPKARAMEAIRLGVASRLLLAFLGISGLAVVGAGVAIYSFRDIGEVLDRITARRVPAALASQEVSRQAERIVAAAPTLLSAATPIERIERSQRIGSEVQALAALLAGLEDRPADGVALGAMQSAVGRLRINLEALDKLVADRIALSERKRSHLRDALDVHAESQGLLAPWLQITEGEIAQLRHAIGDPTVGAEDRAAAGRKLVGATASNHALQRMQFLITSVTDRLQQITTTEDIDSVRVLAFRIKQALDEARRTATGLDPRLQPLLTARLDRFQAHAEGSEAIPELRLKELAIVEGKVQLDRSHRRRSAEPVELNPDCLALCGTQHRFKTDCAQPEHASDCRRQSRCQDPNRRRRRNRPHGRGACCVSRHRHRGQGIEPA